MNAELIFIDIRDNLQRLILKEPQRDCWQAVHNRAIREAIRNVRDSLRAGKIS